MSAINQASLTSQQAVEVLNSMSPEDTEAADAAIGTWMRASAGYFSTLGTQLQPLFAALGQQTGEASWDEVINSLATAGDNLQGLAAEVEATGYEANQGKIEAALDLPGLTSNPFENPTWQQVASGSPECTKLSDEMTAQLTPPE